MKFNIDFDVNEEDVNEFESFWIMNIMNMILKKMKGDLDDDADSETMMN